MINFENSDSPFFTRNKAFILENLKEFGEENFDGWCNAYGYEIDGEINKNELNFFVQFKKSQTTQNGVIIPVDSKESMNIKIATKDLNTRFNFQYRQNLISKIIDLIQLKLKLSEKIPEDKLRLIQSFLKENQIFKLKIKRRELTLLAFNSDQKPAELFFNLYALIGELNK